MPLDLLIKNGLLVDGTGRTPYAGDVGIAGGRIVDMGKVDGPAQRTIDAGGMAVAPGFIDPHTHYDAQISWDPVLNSSSEHGVTTVVLGNCSVGVAPCRPEHHDLLIQELINVEGMSEQVLSAGINWEWESFPDYLHTAGSKPCAVNRSFLVPLSPLRTYVLGSEASERAATPAETATIAGLLDAAMAAGASGFSSTNNRSQIGYQGKALAARLTSRDEYAQYCKVLRERRRGVIEIAVTNKFATLADDEYELLDLLLTESARPVTWISLLNDPRKPNGCREVLDKADPLLRRGCAPQMLLRSMLREFTLKQPYPWSEILVMTRVFNRPADEQLKAYRDPEFRRAFHAELAEGRRFTGYPPKVIVCRTGNPALRKYETRTVGEIAAEKNRDPLDTLFDIAIEDNLETLFAYERGNSDQNQIADMLRDPRSMIGLSDGGAHVDLLYEAGYPTYLLSHWVRDKQVLSLERAVQRMTSEPADFLGFPDRGRLRAGNAADVVIFDPQTIGSSERASFIYDLPAGAGRLHSRASGIAWVLVGGEPIYRNGVHTGALPGTLIASS